MVRARRGEIIDQLRQRILRGLATGALCAGDRLASTRDMSEELGADPRVVAAAYHALAREGLVELRARSGVFLRPDAQQAGRRMTPPVDVVVDLLTQTAIRGYSPTELVGVMQRVLTSRQLRTVVLATTADQGMGIARELKEDFGVAATSMLIERARGDAALPALQRAQLLVSTNAHAKLVESLARQAGRPFIIVSIRSDLFEQEWTLWHGQPVHVIVLDPRFRNIVQEFLRASGAAEAAVRVHLATGSLKRIPADAPTYVTQAARAHLGHMKIPGMVIPPTRLFADDCVRALWRTIAELNMRASQEAPDRRE